MTNPSEIALYTLTQTYGVGYTGKRGSKCWVARITGSDAKYGLARTFVDADKSEREHYNRAKTTVKLTWNLPAGLYEMSEHGERRVYMIAPKKDGGLGLFSASDARIKAYVEALDAGSDDDAARKASKGL